MKPFYFFILFLIFIASCGKDRNYVIVDMRFEIPYSVTPIKDSILLTDTLTLTLQFSDSVKDRNTNKNYKVKNFNWGLFLSISKLVDSTKTISSQIYATSNFKFLTSSGSLQNLRSTGIDIYFLYTNDQYKLIAKIIPLQRGTYTLSMIPSIRSDNGFPDSVLTLPNNSEGKRQIPYYTFPYLIANNGVNNFNLLALNANVGNSQSSEWVSYYTFVVK